ncbi:hypothetical protein L1987_27774 [Smallanthus sonchifolius]|uniref:Uncharacterized protein n=1 Tax=Smallanthus sonchifolius TaxID=185202 RepID=A0ACB9ICZ9_9ASTR|nr:hypothetical protein L1987_27774 [Smallanthus sonchifolius]
MLFEPMCVISEWHRNDETMEHLLTSCYVASVVWQEGWWFYEFCYNKRLRQIHLEDDKEVVQEFVFGEYDAEATSAYKRYLSGISTLKDPRSKDSS